MFFKKVKKADLEAVSSRNADQERQENKMMRAWISFGVVIILLILLFFASINIGSLKVGFGELFSGLFVKYNKDVATIYDLRFPRIIISMLAGAAIAVSGVLFQAVLKNPLADPGNGTDSLYVINPLGERKVQRLVYGTERIERYEILQHGEVSYLLYKLATEAKPRIYAVDVSRLGDISLSEYILCKEQTMQELEKRCKENDKNYNEAIRKTQEDYESRLKSTVKNMEQRYKQQYDELAKLTQGMQEEGRKWRELYYKSVTKD